MIRLLRSASVLALLCLTASAGAKPTSSTCKHGPWIALEWGDDWSAGERRAVLEHLRRGFEVYGVSVCEKSTKTQELPLAEVSFSSAGRDSVSLSVDVRDSVTQKRVGRDVDVRGYSKEGQALAVAIATEELVRASWVELELDSPHNEEPPKRRVKNPEAADAVRRVNQDSIRSEPIRLRLELRGMLETYSGGQTHWGADLALRQALGSGFGLGLALGPRVALRESSRLGDVTASLLAGEAFAWANIIRGATVALDWEVGLRGGLLRYQSQPQAGAAITENAGVLIAKTSLTLDLALGSAWYLGLNAGVGHSLMGATATGRGRELTSVSGLELHGGLGFGGQW